MELATADPSDLEPLARLAERCQLDPERHCVYVGLDAASIASEVADIPEWHDTTTVVTVDARFAGWLLAEVDDELRRIWWWGPFVDEADWADWADIADALYTAARDALVHRVPAAATYGEELAADGRSVSMRQFAARHGFSTEEGSVCLVKPAHPLGSPARPSAASVPAAGLVALGTETPDVVAAGVAALHDQLFPGTHTTGQTLAAGGDRLVRLAAIEGDEVVGYVAVEHQHDGSLYIDFVGVTPGHTGRGVGRRLVAEACRLGFEQGATWAHLTVRESNAGARSLYRSLGFEEERILAPFRRGFSIT